jgi:hypothetical protein
MRKLEDELAADKHKEMRRLNVTLDRADAERMNQLCRENGEEPLFVLYKCSRKLRKLESVATYPAEQVARAELPGGRIVIGMGTVEPTH